MKALQWHVSRCQDVALWQDVGPVILATGLICDGGFVIPFQICTSNFDRDQVLIV